MKITKLIWAWAFCLLVLASCNKNEGITPDDKPAEGKTVTVLGVLDQTAGTKAGIVEGNYTFTEGEKMYWVNNDEIKLVFVKKGSAAGTDYSASPFKATAGGSDPKIAEFTGTLPGGIEDGSYTVYACLKDMSQKPGEDVFTFNAAAQTQTGKSSEGAFVNMVIWAAPVQITVSGGTIEGGTLPELRFKHLNSLLRFIVTNGTGKELTVKSITVSAVDVEGNPANKFRKRAEISMSSNPPAWSTTDTPVDKLTVTVAQNGTEATLGVNDPIDTLNVYMPVIPTDGFAADDTLKVEVFLTDAQGNGYRRQGKVAGNNAGFPFLTGGFKAAKRCWFGLNLTAGNTPGAYGVVLNAGGWDGTEVLNPGGTAQEIPTVLIPAGSFMMGSPAVGVYLEEKPQHKVNISKAFRMSKYEITNAQYCEFLNAKGIVPVKSGSFSVGKLNGNMMIRDCKVGGLTQRGVTYETDKWIPASGKENYPVIYVSWYGAVEFALWSGGRLPTEAEWEYACRAGTETKWSFGDTDANIGDYAWYIGNNGSSGEPDYGTKAVGQKLANPWGLYDIHGNVVEWCADSWSANYLDAEQTDPLVTVGNLRVMRGGAWGNVSDFCRSAFRNNDHPAAANNVIGFRVVFVP